MNWQKRESGQATEMPVDAEQVAVYEQAKAEKLPVIEKEAGGIRPFEQIKFQQVRAHSFFDAEFAVKGEDLIFHFWPYDFHAAQRANLKEPTFPAMFEHRLHEAMLKHFTMNRLEIKEDEDMGAFFVKAHGYAKVLSPVKLAVDACKDLYVLLGGELKEGA